MITRRRFLGFLGVFAVAPLAFLGVKGKASEIEPWDTKDKKVTVYYRIKEGRVPFARELAESCRKAQERMAAGVFNNSFTI